MSNSPKMLNLDDIAPIEERALTYKGIRYPMQPASVATFIRVTQELEQMEKDNAGLAQQVLFMTSSITDAFPTLDEETVQSMSFDQISAIFNFIRGDATVENETAKKKPAKKTQK